MATRKCGIQANGGMIGYAQCDLPWGHPGDVHSNTGDGFRAPEYDKQHHHRQAAQRGADAICRKAQRARS